MPNWAYTNITFSGKDAEKFYDDIQKWTSFNALENGFGKMWLGNVVINSGLVKPEHINDSDTPRCRGSIIYIEGLNDDSFSIDEETAWVPMIEMWQRIIDKYKYDISITFVGEEPSCEVYMANDPVFIGKYNVQCYAGSDQIRKEFGSDLAFTDELSKDQTIDFLKQLLKAYSVTSANNDIDALYEKVMSVAEKDFELLGIHKYQEVDVYEV